MLQRSDLRAGPGLTAPVPTIPPRETVLVLDDSRAQRSLLTSLLRKWGHDVVACADPAKALDIACDPAIGLIISDWMMPGMTGPEFCRNLRAARGEGYAYVILLTSKSERGALAEGLEAGADDFLSKPVRPPELQARLNAGARIVAMQREVMEKNQLLTSALGEIQNLYSALDDDLEEARRLQQSLLQDRFRRFANVDMSLWLQASGHVGGDMVGFFPVSNAVIGTFSLDVSGHGVASAMIAARIAGILSDASPDQNIALMRREDGSLAALPPDMAAWRLNSMLLKELRTDRYFTMCLAFLNRVTGIVRLVQAGHPHPMVLRASGAVELVGQGGLPIGLVPEASFTTIEVRLRPGDRLLMYSDGVTECPSPAGAALDEDGLERMMLRHRCARGPEFLGHMARDLIDFAGTDTLPDDASALLIEFNDPGAAEAGDAMPANVPDAAPP
jgi:sigma-B regulation protein RsbU (phosphoserine phosphatase)